MNSSGPAPARVLIYRLGELGDTLLALPLLKLARRAFPGAAFALLTIRSRNPEISMPAMLRGFGLTDTVITYAMGERSPAALLKLRRQIRDFAPDVLVYLAEPRGLAQVWRDWLFFRACGVSRIIGAPLSPDVLRHRFNPADGLWESEQRRLARALAGLGDARLEDPASRDPELLADELAEADSLLNGWPGAGDYIAACVNVRTPARDWGEARWAALLEKLAADFSGSGLMLVGGPADEPRSQRLAACWPGPVMVATSQSPRVKMALLRHARLFVGTNCGPTQMAAAVGVPVVAVFAADLPHGVWFPAGPTDGILHCPPPCAGCRQPVCPVPDHPCLQGVAVETVAAACRRSIKR